MNIIKKLSFLIVFIIFTACGTNRPVGFDAPGLDELKRLCEKDAGLKIYKTVEADGYYDDTTQCHHCWQGLIKRPSQYVEFCADGTKKSSSYILKEPGCYRLTKVARDTNQCHAGIDERYANFIVEPYASFKQDNCIKVESIEKPSPGPGLFLKKDERIVTGERFGISRYEYTIKSNDSEQKYGRFINYSLVVKYGAGYSCGSSAVIGERVSVKNPSFYKEVISKVIKNKN